MAIYNIVSRCQISDYVKSQLTRYKAFNKQHKNKIAIDEEFRKN